MLGIPWWRHELNKNSKDETEKNTEIITWMHGKLVTEKILQQNQTKHRRFPIQ